MEAIFNKIELWYKLRIVTKHQWISVTGSYFIYLRISVKVESVLKSWLLKRRQRVSCCNGFNYWYQSFFLSVKILLCFWAFRVEIFWGTQTFFVVPLRLKHVFQKMNTSPITEYGDWNVIVTAPWTWHSLGSVNLNIFLWMCVRNQSLVRNMSCIYHATCVAMIICDLTY